ncbi:rRNA 2'-O-methyltransferase fibrillarin [Drosophila mauritiana]|uniref:rRNA 2'-O-methyltransferase fibrillarin n=1 Tax=Drosophila mauritiana TaxID=7226 RepID=A0A6P8KL29_DROMA|nr:rRNA 2'-O-methyltransferase fibrillarin [Drosophila mauritiana]
MESKSKRRSPTISTHEGEVPGKSTHPEDSKITANHFANPTKITSIKSPIKNSEEPSMKPESKRAIASIWDIESAGGDSMLSHCQSEGNVEDQGQEQEVMLETSIFTGTSERIEPHRHYGVYLLRNRFDAIQLLTRNTSSSADDYGEQRVISEYREMRCEFRVWSPFQSKLAAGIMGGVSDLHLQIGSKVLYLGAGFGRSVSHISDIVGESGMVYAVEQIPWAGSQLTVLANRRSNIVPIVEDATMPYKYRYEVPACIDIIFADLPPSILIRALMLNARHFLNPGGHFVAYLHSPNSQGVVFNKDSFAAERRLLKEKQLEPKEMVLLEPFKAGYAFVVGVYTRKDVSL